MHFQIFLELVNHGFQTVYMLVPVLIGMDFIRQNGLVMDFTDGFSVYSACDNATPCKLPMNNKNHVMVDIVEYMTGGRHCREGHPEINVLIDESAATTGADSREGQALFTQPLLFAVDGVDESRAFPGSDPRRAFLNVWERRQELSGQSRLMGASLSRAIDRDQQRQHDHADQEGEVCYTGGQRAPGSSRSTRSEMQFKPMAMLQQPSPRQAAGEQVGQVDQLLNLRSTSGVSTSCRSSGKPDQRGETRQCREGAGGAEDSLGRGPVAHGGDGARDDREGDGRHSDGQAPGGVQGNMALELQEKVTRAQQLVSSQTTSRDPGARSSVAEGYADPKTSPSWSTASWEAVEPIEQSRDFFKYLRAEEREQIQARIAERREQQTQPTRRISTDEELEPDYSRNSL